MPALTTSSFRARWIGGLRAEIVTLFNRIFQTIAMDWTAGHRTLTATTSATNPALGTSSGHLALTSGNPSGGGVIVPLFAGNVANLQDGVLWLDTTANQLKVRINGVTRVVTVT